MKDDLITEIERLRTEIAKHNTLYHELSNPVITDYEYDLLVKKLQKLETDAGLKDESPLDRVGSDLGAGAKTIPHRQRMYSLDNAYSIEEVLAWLQKTSVLAGTGSTPEVCMEYKIDGFSVNLFYDKGLLQYATTRGDGTNGEVITQNVQTIPGIPQQIEYLSPIEIRGEVYISKADFIQMNEERQKNEERLFANPRNAAAGSIKLKDPAETAKRHLKAILYGIGYMERSDFSGQEDVLLFLKKQGFPVSTNYMVSSDPISVRDFCKSAEKEREKLIYEVDGIVIKINELSLQNRLGYTSKIPKWAIAYKFPPEIKETRLQEIRFQTGRTGAVTPVAILEPVYISGSTVSRCTLHNEDEISRLDLHEGDCVRIIKSGEIIPKIIEAVTEKRRPDAKPLQFTSVCPSCNQPLSKLQELDSRSVPGMTEELDTRSVPGMTEVLDSRTVPGMTEELDSRSEPGMTEELDSWSEPGMTEVLDSRSEPGMTKESVGSIFYCTNPNCPAQLQKRLEHFCSRDAMDIMGMGESMISRFIEEGLLSSIPEIYRIDLHRVAQLDRMGEKTASNLKTAIETSKSRNLDRLIFGLGIRYIGARTASILAEYFKDIESLLSTDIDTLTAIPEIGEKTASTIIDFISNPNYRRLIEELTALGLNTKYSMEYSSENLSGKSFLITGTLSRQSRNQAEELIRKHGGKILGSVSKNLDYLIVGENPGSKLTKAEKISTIKIIGEEELDKLITSGTQNDTDDSVDSRSESGMTEDSVDSRSGSGMTDDSVDSRSESGMTEALANSSPAPKDQTEIDL